MEGYILEGSLGEKKIHNGGSGPKSDVFSLQNARRGCVSACRVGLTTPNELKFGRVVGEMLLNKTG